MTAIVEGIYKDGKLDLLQTPAGLPEGRVRVILIASEVQTTGAEAQRAWDEVFASKLAIRPAPEPKDDENFEVTGDDLLF